MEDHLNKALELIDKIALDVVMLESDNVDRFGVVLKRLDELNQVVASIQNDSILEFSNVIKSIVEKILVEDISTEEGIQKVADGVSLFQEILRDEKHGLSYSEKVATFLKKHGISSPSNTIPVNPTTFAADELKESLEDEELHENKGDQAGVEVTQVPVQDKELLASFISESQDHLESIEVNILSLEQEPENLEAINAIFRPFHTIKGVAGFLDLKEINYLAHEVETLLDNARDQKLIINEEVIDIVLESVDLMKILIEHLKKESIATGVITSAGLDLNTFVKKLRSVTQSDFEAMQEQEDVSFSSRMSAEDGSEVSDMDKGSLLKKTDLKAGVCEQQERRESKEKQDGREVTPKKIVGQPTFIRVDTKKLDNMVDMVGELVITQSMIHESAALATSKDQKLYRNLAQLGRITSEVQRISMSMRMVPIKQTFHKMIRLVRDLSKKSGKLVTLKMSGEDTEIDRNMVEEIYDPLVHMIRNAVDHGIEMPDEREASGKPRMGTVKLRAYHKGGNIVIKVNDDGRGLDRSRILKKAIENGLVRPDEKISDQEIHTLIFQPGFSTADQITDVSGRGVGMDVVKRAIDNMRGKLEVRSEKNIGSTVIMRLPLTLAIIDGMLVQAGDREYIIPTISVVESLRPAREFCSTVVGRGEMIKIRDNILPLIRLHKLFGIEPKYYNPWEAIVVVVENEGRRKCILVDE
jgi:two-component system chemotaxis sensor kinase CheA